MTEHKDMCDTLTLHCTNFSNGLPPLKNCKVVADKEKCIYVLVSDDGESLYATPNAEEMYADITRMRLLLKTFKEVKK